MPGGHIALYASFMIGLIVLAATSISCPVEKAVYTLRTAPQYTAEFRDVASGSDWPTGIAFGVRSAITNRSYWWLPGIPGSSGLKFMYSTTDVEAKTWKAPSADGGPRPLGELGYISTDASYRVLDDIPKRDAPAPAHLLFATLGGVLWYGNFMINQPRERPPTQFFDLTDCRPVS